MDAGILLTRVVLGSLMAAHGAQKLFGWFGGYGIAGTGGFFESLGFKPGRFFAAAAGFSERNNSASSGIRRRSVSRICEIWVAENRKAGSTCWLIRKHPAGSVSS